MKIIFDEVSKDEKQCLIDVAEALLGAAKSEAIYEEIERNSGDMNEALLHLEKAKHLACFNQCIIDYLKESKNS